MNFSYSSSEYIFTFSSFYLLYFGKIVIYFDNVSFPFWVSIIFLALLKRLVNAAKCSFLSCLILNTRLISLNIDSIGYRLSW